MLAIARKEFVEMTRSFKSLFVISLFTAASYFMSSFVSKNFVSLGAGTNDFTSATRLLVLLFGFLFVLMLSHDVVSKETSTKTIRFLLTKTSRMNIIIGKFLGVSTFWFFCIGSSFVIISIFAKAILWLPFLQLYSFLVFAIGLCILISTFVRTTSGSLLIGLTVSFVVPTLGLWSMFSEKAWLKPFQLLLPYNYQLKESMLLFLPLLFGLCFVALSMLHFKRGDY